MIIGGAGTGVGGVSPELDGGCQPPVDPDVLLLVLELVELLVLVDVLVDPLVLLVVETPPVDVLEVVETPPVDVLDPPLALDVLEPPLALDVEVDPPLLVEVM